MIKQILNIIKKFNKISLRFDLPNSKKILQFDETHSQILRQIIKKDFNILKVRDEKEIYFWIFIKQIIFFDFRFLTYCKNYIKYTSPKVIITFIDTNIQFYELKNNFKDINFISIQNGHRFENYSMFHNKKYINSQKLKCDHIFVFNKYYVKEYKRIIKSKYHILGNFKNNIVKINKTKINKQFLFISQFVKNHKKKIFQKKLLNFINLYLLRNKKKLHILLRNKNNLKQKKEIEFYKKILRSNCVFHKTSKWKNSYKILDKFENIIFMFSTFGYEAIARKKKVVIFSPSRDSNFILNFGWPGLYKKGYDFFSAKNLTYGEIKRVLTNVNNCSQVKWNRTYYKKVKDQLYLSKKNAKLKKVLFKLL
jgi:surface carbohydrate biosynthesis protein